VALIRSWKGLRPAARGAIAALGVWAFFLATGRMGIDFGEHWDEWYQVQGVKDCVEKTAFFPQKYIYNGLYFSLGLPALLWHLRADIPGALKAILDAPPSLTLDPASVEPVKQLQASAREFLSSKKYLLDTRIVFMVLASSAIFSVYVACRRLRPSRVSVAVAGAAFLACSWEFQYHARWVAIDAPLACFVALQFALVSLGMTSAAGPRAVAFFVAAAAAGGCALGCKATGILALLPALIVPWAARRPFGWRARLGLTAVSAIVFLAAAFVVSPAIFVDPLRTLATASYIEWDYNHASTHTNVVSGFPEHVLRLLLWLGAAVPSPSPVRAVPMAAVVALGLVSLCRRHPRLALTWLPLLAAFIAFLARNHLLVVRQYMLLVPFMAVMFGLGVGQLADGLRRASWRRAAAALLVMALGLNARWLYDAAQSIRNTSVRTIQAALLADMVREGRAIRVSPGIHTAMKDAIDDHFACVPAASDPRAVPREVAFQWGEHPLWRCNRLGTIDHTYGSREANYDWYSAFRGKFPSERILKVSLDFGSSIGLDTTSFLDCAPKR